MGDSSVASRPYRWGKFQGWVLLLFGVLGAVRGHSSFLLLNLWGVTGAVIQIAAGIGVAKKLRYGVVLFYLCCALFVVGFYVFFVLFGSQGIDFDAFSISYCAFMALWWGIPAAFYYPKRWKEFTGGTSVLPDIKRNVRLGLDTTRRALRNRYTWLVFGSIIFVVAAVSIPFWPFPEHHDTAPLSSQSKQSDSGKRDDWEVISSVPITSPPASKQLDFEAIARKYGGVPATEPPASKSPDYAALAKKYGGTIEPPRVLPPNFNGWDTPSPVNPNTTFGTLCKKLSTDVVGVPPGFQAVPLPSTEFNLSEAQPYVPTPQDYAQGVLWCRKAADQGNAWAQTSLGYMYQSGLGVAQDNVEAAAWYEKAAAGGNSEAKEKLDEVRAAIEASRKEKAARALRIEGIILGSCALLAAIFLAMRFRKALTPRTIRGRQALVLLPVALWCSACCLYPALSPVLMRHPIDAAVRAFLLSMPALLFGAVALWMVSSPNPVAPHDKRLDTEVSQ